MKEKLLWILLAIFFLLLIVARICFTEKFTSLDSPQTWILNLYKTLNWTNAPMSDNGGVVSQDWIKWAQNSPNAILQYYVNYRRSTQHMLDTWPTNDKDIILNPVYAWDGLANAVYIWNKAVDLNNNSKNKPLGNVAYFCNEDDELKRKMTLAAFLGNATVESAFFLVCKESTTLVDGTICPGGNEGDPTFNPRYFNNCDQANPLTYSCQGGGGGGGGGSCSPAGKTFGSVCSTTGCFPTDTKKNYCNVSGDGVTWASWDETIVKDKNACDSKLKKNGGQFNYAFWCPGKTPHVTPGPTKPPVVFNPVKDKCTGGWPVCQFPGADGKFISLPPSDPCMTDPYADGSNRSPLDNNNPTCSDWNGNKWKQQQECYFGRGLIQLTWSCNYYQAQRNLFLMASLIDDDSNDNLLQQFKKSVNLPFNNPDSINLCANPDALCGNYTIESNAKVVYSSNEIQRAIPWLSCIIYWATKCAPAFNKCYSFQASYQGIAPSGAGNPSVRLNAMKFMMGLMGENVNDTKKFINTDTEFRLNSSDCSDTPGPGPSPGPGPKPKPKKGGSVCGDGKDWTFNNCQAQSCTSDTDCPKNMHCYNAAGVC